MRSSAPSEIGLLALLFALSACAPAAQPESAKPSPPPPLARPSATATATATPPDAPSSAPQEKTEFPLFVIARAKHQLVLTRPSDTITVLERSSPRRLHTIGDSTHVRETELEQALGSALEDVDRISGSGKDLFATISGDKLYTMQLRGKAWKRVDFGGELLDAWTTPERSILFVERMGVKRALVKSKSATITLKLPPSPKQMGGLAPPLDVACKSLLLTAVTVDGETLYATAAPCFRDLAGAMVQFVPPAFKPAATELPRTDELLLDSVTVDGSSAYVLFHQGGSHGDTPAFIARFDTSGKFIEQRELPVKCSSLQSAIGRDGALWVLCDQIGTSTLVRLLDGKLSEQRLIEGARTHKPRALVGDRKHGIFVGYYDDDALLVSDRARSGGVLEL